VEANFVERIVAEQYFQFSQGDRGGGDEAWKDHDAQPRTGCLTQEFAIVGSEAGMTSDMLPAVADRKRHCS
jgi:hypothetical protein